MLLALLAAHGPTSNRRHVRRLEPSAICRLVLLRLRIRGLRTVIREKNQGCRNHFYDWGHRAIFARHALDYKSV